VMTGFFSFFSLTLLAPTYMFLLDPKSRISEDVKLTSVIQLEFTHN
jgi:hypothetical protein